MISDFIRIYKALISNRKVVLTLLILILSTGSYTFSEITTATPALINDDKSSGIIVTGINIKFPIYAIERYGSYLPDKNITLNISPSEDVMDKGNISAEALSRFLLNHNPKINMDYAEKIAQLYKSEASHEGVNSDLAFAQMCLETGFLNYGGDVEAEQYNFCGLGATGNGVKGLTFSSPEEGIRAHIQHLKAYGSTLEIRNELVDTRFRFVSRVSGVELRDLTGKWATDKKYDIKIRQLMKRLYKMSTDNTLHEEQLSL